jgi:hypothetical protein
MVALDRNFLQTHLPAILEGNFRRNGLLRPGEGKGGVEIALLKQVYWRGGVDN